MHYTIMTVMVHASLRASIACAAGVPAPPIWHRRRVAGARFWLSGKPTAWSAAAGWLWSWNRGPDRRLLWAQGGVSLRVAIARRSTLARSATVYARPLGLHA